VRDRLVITAIILAAGASTRLGEPKQLVRLLGETLLERTIRTAREAGCEVVVVLGAQTDRIREQCNLHGARAVINQQWPEGMASSIRAGVQAAEGSDGVMLMTCDQPAVTAEHLRRLSASGEVTASSYAGRRGVPAYFPASSFPSLRQLTGDKGALDLLNEAAAIDLPGGELDIDTAAARNEAERRFS
jgi:CTP:molybdopterin cytidylyltransferase MocA